MKLLKRVVAVCPVVLFFALLWIRQAPLIGAVAAPFSEAVIQANQGSWGNNLADLNGDGFVDVLEGGGDLGGNVYWYLYPTWQRFQIGADGGGDDLQVADINHDGAPDVVVNGSSKIVWYENPRGTGGNVQALWTKHVVDATTRSHDIVVADLNRDGKLDIVIRVEEGATFYYLQGATPDTWTRILINQAPNGHGGLEVADINRDGRPDIVENGFWLEGPANYAVDTWIRHDIVPWTFGSSAVVYDINHDGRLDIFLAVSESGPGSLAWFEAPVDPINGTWIRHNIDTVEDVHRFYLVDVNKDGTEDLVFAEMHQSATKRVGVYYNNGLGASWTLQVLSTQGSHNIAVGDVGNDGDIDIIGANWNTSAPDGGAMKIWRNDLDNAIPVNQWTYIEADNTRSQNNTFGLTAGDIDKDGWPDILSGQYWYRNPQGNLAGPWTRTGIGPYDGLFLMDVDDDGNMDILGQAMINSTTVGFYRLTPSANFSSWTPLLVGTTPPTHPVNPDHWSSHGFRLSQIVPGGKPEIVLTSEKSIYYFQVPANPALGNWPRVEITNTLWGQSDVEMSDVDGDGDADAIGFYAPQNLAWWENPGDGSALWVRHDIGTTPDQMGGRVAVGDFNGDGRKDVVVSEANFSTSGNGVYWFECPANALTPSWTRRTVLTNLGSIHSVEVGDYDQNGTPDILTGTHRGTLQAMIMRTADHGVTWTTTIVNTGFEAHIALRTFDLDRDGDLDIISDAWDHYQFLYMWRNNALGGAAVDSTPPQISQVTSSQVSAMSAQVNWATNEPADSTVEYGPNSNYGAAVTLIPLVAGHTVTLTGLTPSTQYHYRVTSKDASANLTTSGDFTFTTSAPDSTPPQITNRSVNPLSPTSATINWTTDEPADGRVEYGADATYGFSTPLQTALVTGHTIVIGGLVANTTYHFRINTKDSSANLAQSLDDMFTTPIPDTTLPTVAISAPTGGAVLGTIGVTASANDNVGVMGVQFFLDGAMLGAEVTTSPFSTSWNTTLVANGSHTLTAVARDAAGNSKTSDPVMVTVANVILFAHRQSVGATNDSSSNTISLPFALPTLAGDLIVAAVSMGSNVSVTCSDSQNNTYTSLPVQYDGSNNQGLVVCYAPNVKAGATTVTATLGGSAPYRRLLIHEYSGLAQTNPVDVTAAAIANGTTAANNISTTAGVTTGNTLIFAAVMDDTGTTGIQAGTSFTLRGSVGGVDLATEDRLQTTAGSFAGTFTFGAAHRYLARMVAFKLGSLPDSTLPDVSITAPAGGGATVSGNVSLNATATDNVGVVGLQYKVDGANIGPEITTGIYNVTWDSTTVMNGTRVLTAVARDATGNTRTSTGVSVNVNNVDSTPPTFQNVTATAITLTGATITWTTNEPATSQVQYGTDTNYGSLTSLDTTTALSHSQSLTGLTPGTTYFFRVLSSDAMGNPGMSAGSMFATATPDTTPPNISGVGATLISMTGATIGWTTNEAASTQIQYGTDTDYGFSTTLNPALTTGHSQPLSGLTPATTYFYRVLSSDGASNTASADSFFTTAAPDLTPPVLSSVTVTAITSSSATVTWTTNEPGTTRVSYGMTTDYGSSTALDPAYALSHSQTISNLQASTLYHVQALSSDAPGNPGSSGDLMFTTLAGEVGVPTVGLLSRWKLNEASGTTAGDSAGTSTGTLGSFACTTLNCNATSGWTVPGQFAGALNFDGADDIVTVLQNATLNDLGSFSYSAWVFPRSLGEGSAGRIIDKSGTGFKRFRLDNVTASSFYGEVRLGTTNAVATSPSNSVSLNQWQHVVMTFDNTTKVLRIYKNGVQIATGTGVGNPQSDATGNLVIGNNAAGAATFNGLIDDVLVYNRALAPSEVLTLASGAPDVTLPQISGQNATGITITAATIVWNTNELADSSVEYGITTDYGTTMPINPALVLSHAVPLSGLTPGTQYHVRVTSLDTSGNAAHSDDFAFTTLPPDITPPVVSSVLVTGLTSATATITWQTNEAATSQVSFGLTSTYGSFTTLDAAFLTSHSQTLTNLQVGTTYHFQALSTDAFGNPGSSGDLTFTTLAGEAGVPTVGLLSRWKLNEVSGTTAGDSAGTSTGTLGSFACTTLNCNATSGWSNAGRFIGALNFDGADDIATVPQNATLNDLGSFTYSAWVFPRSLGEGSAGRIIDKSGTGYKRFRLNNATANSFYGEVRLGTTNAVATSAASTVTLNQWQHVVMTFDNTTKILRIYKNGVQIATATGAGNPQSDATGNFLIGNNAAGAATFNGLIDDVLVYNRALTPSEIQTLASGAPDLTLPQISGQSATGLTTTAATVVWNTDEASDTSVQYGLDTNYGTTTPVSPALVLAHSVPLSGLTPGTTYQARVLSRDSSGNLAQSANFSFSTVTPDTTPPSVSLSTPAAGSVTGTVNITASANDDTGVASVQYFLDGTTALSGLLSGSPYTFAWNTTVAANGPHTLTAVAKDATGNATTSAGINVTVSNVVPLVGFVQSASSSSDAPGMTIPQAFNGPVTVGNLIVAAVSWGRDGAFTCSDSQGNVYSMLTATYDSTNDQSLGLCYAANAKGGATTVTVTFTSSVKYRRLLVHEYFGIAKANPLDVSVARTAAGTTAANNISSGSVTTTANGDLVFVAVMDDAGTTNTTAGTGFTLRATTASDLSSEDRVLPAVGAVTGTFTFSTAHRYIIRIVTFKAGS